MEVTGQWECSWCGHQEWADSGDNPPEEWVSLLWPDGSRQDLCASCNDIIEAGCALFTRLCHENKWDKKTIKSAKEDIIALERNKYYDQKG